MAMAIRSIIKLAAAAAVALIGMLLLVRFPQAPAAEGATPVIMHEKTAPLFGGAGVCEAR
jgi:hypothetical protein